MTLRTLIPTDIDTINRLAVHADLTPEIDDGRAYLRIDDTTFVADVEEICS